MVFIIKKSIFQMLTFVGYEAFILKELLLHMFSAIFGRKTLE